MLVSGVASSKTRDECKFCTTVESSTARFHKASSQVWFSKPSTGMLGAAANGWSFFLCSYGMPSNCCAVSVYKPACWRDFMLHT